jgi:hypothetical protein
VHEAFLSAITVTLRHVPELGYEKPPDHAGG